MYLSDCNWLVDHHKADEAVMIRLRNTGTPVSGQIMGEQEGLVHLRLDEPQYGVACGQAGVLYDGNDRALVYGGGWITKAPTIAETAL